MRGRSFILVIVTLLVFITAPVFSSRNNLNNSQKKQTSNKNMSKFRPILPENKSERIASLIKNGEKIAIAPVKAEEKITKKQIIINPTQTAFQGDTVHILVKTPKNLTNPYFIYKGKKINLYKTEQGIYRGFIGLSAFEKTGKFTLSFKDSSTYLCDSRSIDIKAKKYPIQNIKLSGKSGGITATKDELRRVGNAKSFLTNAAYWHKIPFTNPTQGCISSIYGLNRYYNGVPGSYHKGVDVAAPKGQSVAAPTNGKILIARMFRLHGGTVAIDHGQGIVSMYLHLSKTSVKEGQLVKEGQKIGEVGSTGISTGPHLHWGIYINGTPVDPFPFWVKPVSRCS